MRSYRNPMRYSPHKSLNRDEVMWSLFAGMAALAAGAAVRQAINYAYRRRYELQPPQNPIHEEVAWSRAMIWGGLTGMLVGASRIAGRRGAGEIWRRMQRRLPPST